MATYYWVRDGLAVLGEKHTGKWLGSASSGAHLIVDKANHPFRRVEIIFLLESRELLPLWLVDLLRDKRDQIIFKAKLRSPRQADVEIAPAASRMARRIQGRTDESWTSLEEGGFYIASRGRDAAAVYEGLQAITTAYGQQVRHISWSKGQPDLIAVFKVHDLLKNERNAVQLFTDISNAVAQASKGEPES